MLSCLDAACMFRGDTARYCQLRNWWMRSCRRPLSTIRQKMMCLGLWKGAASVDIGCRPLLLDLLCVLLAGRRGRRGRVVAVCWCVGGGGAVVMLTRHLDRHPNTNPKSPASPNHKACNSASATSLCLTSMLHQATSVESKSCLATHTVAP